MKLLINICSHDGIISYYTGVGTMVKRNIKALIKYASDNNIDYHINLITPEYNPDSFGYSEKTYNEHLSLKNTSIIQISNGSNGKINYGTPNHFIKLSENTAEFINNIDISSYDKVITLLHDTTMAGVIERLNVDSKHKKVWIPHSTVKIHKVDSAIEGSENFYKDREDLEQSAIDYINKDENSYIGAICEYVKEHLVNDYNLDENKALMITNGEIFDDKVLSFSKECDELYKKIDELDSILISFGRAEEYKNLECTMALGKEIGIDTVVIAQSYYKEQPILDEYRSIAKENNTHLYIDPPFDFSKYILNNFDKPIIALIPSKREVMGLIVNELRKLNRDNILVVANSVGGLVEQIEDGVDGVLVNLDNIIESKEKILKYFNVDKMKELNKNAQITLKNKYDYIKNFNEFISKL